MKIAPKIVLLFLPLLVAPLVLATLFASVAARAGITSVAEELLRFKAEELHRFAVTQYALLVDNSLSEEAAFVEASQRSVASYAAGLVRRDSELIFAADETGELAFVTGDFSPTPEDRELLAQMARSGRTGWVELPLEEEERVAHVARFDPFAWSLFVTELSDLFYAPVALIFRRSALILLAAIVMAALLMALFSSYITRPLHEVVGAMHSIIATGELSRRVSVEFADETGDLAESFNSMTEALSRAYEEIKNYALQAAVAERKEMKIRNVFQKYVPNQVIEQFFASPETMLVGEERRLAVLFSDIRNFTTLSESLSPGSLVESLNGYFSRMVSVIMDSLGVVDKYIGDAIMAFFGAPAPDEESCLHAVEAAFGMLGALQSFNEDGGFPGSPSFKIGIGINYGDVTIGNIGSEQKMDYTVIGDTVNLASRLEGASKRYGEPIIISESVKRELPEEYYRTRLLDKVIVKGKTKPVSIYAIRERLSPTEADAWEIYRNGVANYYEGAFELAVEAFEEARAMLPSDKPTAMFLERSQVLRESELPEGWNGVTTLTEK